MIDMDVAKKAIYIIMTEQMFLSDGEIETITGHDREEFGGIMRKLENGGGLNKKDYNMIHQALNLIMNGFEVPPSILEEHFGHEHQEVIGALMARTRNLRG